MRLDFIRNDDGMYTITLGGRQFLRSSRSHQQNILRSLLRRCKRPLGTELSDLLMKSRLRFDHTTFGQGWAFLKQIARSESVEEDSWETELQDSAHDIVSLMVCVFNLSRSKSLH